MNKKAMRFFSKLFILNIFISCSLICAPRVSILTTIYNGDQFIEPFLDDISKQTIFDECELIIINAASPGNEEEKIQRFMHDHPNTRYFKLDTNNGRYAALNYAIGKAESEYIYMASLDNRVKSDALETFANELDAHPLIDLVYGDYLVTEKANETFKNNTFQWQVNCTPFTSQALYQCITGPQPMWRALLHEKYGLFDENFNYSGNWEMWNRAASKGSIFKKVDCAATLYYYNPNGLTTTADPRISSRRNFENHIINQEYKPYWEGKKPIIATSNQKSFVVVIPSYNNSEWYTKNLDSVRLQSYKNYRVIYIDDASSDGTGSLVENYIKEHHLEKKWELIKNESRKGVLANHYRAIHQCNPDEIVVTLDGDDWFSHNYVLERLNEVYQDPEVWLTYGQFMDSNNYLGCCKQLPDDVIANTNIRTYLHWVTSQLRTFYASLFHRIQMEDLLYEDGTFYPMAGDVAFMIPLIEMAGKHVKFIDEVLYIYNRSTPLNDDKINRSLQIQCDLHIRNKKPYKPLVSLFQNNQHQNIKNEITEKPMVIVIPSYKNSEWYERNLDSVFNQEYSNYRVIYIDDVSPDNTYNLVKSYVDTHNLHDKILLIQNRTRKGAMHNLYNAIHSCAPHEIIVTVDGDDWLAHNKVLSHLNEIYANEDVWLTYGQFEYYPYECLGLSRELPYEVIQKRSVRSFRPWVTSHLRTFYADLFQQVKKEDLIYKDTFYPMGWDVAMIIPMIEMAGDHFRFIPEILYMYNRLNPISDDKINLKLQEDCEDHIRNRTCYNTLQQLPHRLKQ